MFKRLTSMGALCIGLMALWGTDANAYPPYLSGWGWKPGSIVFESTWVGTANTEQKPTDYQVTLFPTNLIVHFRNPGNNLGGISVNFTNPNLFITGGNTLFPTALTGKGKITDELTFGDCPGIDNPSGECQVGDNGKLWLLWEVESGCVETDPYMQIGCIKDYLADTYAPNLQWRPYAIDIFNFDAIVEAYTDMNTRCESGGFPDPTACFDGKEEVIHANYSNCQLNEDVYICSSYEIWQYKNNDPLPTLCPHDGTDPVTNCFNQLIQ